MPSIVIITKSGEVEQHNIKSSSIDDLYKRAGFKSGENFNLLHSWNIENVTNGKIGVYGKLSGKSNQINKYDFPPPIDNTLIYGNIVIARISDSDDASIINLTSSEWEKIYEELFGGFEDIGEKDSEYSVDTEYDKIPANQLTRDGYVKDGFIVDSDEEDEVESVVSTPVKKKGKRNTTPTSSKKQNSVTVTGGKKKKSQEVEVDFYNDEQPKEMNYTDELEEEPYI